jgi:O-methyltransferase
MKSLFKKNQTSGQSNFSELQKKVAAYTMCDTQRLESLWNLINSTNKLGVKGDIVECGCYKGGSAALLRAGMGPGRRLWIYDSFQGMPETTEQDGGEAGNWVGSCTAHIDDVREILRHTEAKDEEFIIREGLFIKTFEMDLPEKVAFLHCDADWYDSVRLVLETFYPRMPKGACIVLDDFGYWEGCRKAFYDFCERHDEKPLLERVGITQAWWIKGKEHNRSG